MEAMPRIASVRPSFPAILVALVPLAILLFGMQNHGPQRVNISFAPKAAASKGKASLGSFSAVSLFFGHNPPHRGAEPAGAASGLEYVGSEACAPCHRSIYNSYIKTDMGRSMTRPNATFLAHVPTSASVFNRRFSRHFELQLRGGNLFQTEYEQTADGEDVFRQTEKIEWIIGAGENGLGAIVRRSDYLFEAPLSYYPNVAQWKLSPGYEYGDYGFSRPVLVGCVVCHSGRPRLLSEREAQFRDPPFEELAIGCENCHGPGAAHVLEKQANRASVESSSIVNPARLSPWLADNICMLCHQTGQARVLHPGKQYGDFYPGNELDETLSIFQIPFGRSAPPKDDLLEHYLSMRLSKCYRTSSGKLSCITCHDPHGQPAKEEAPAYFREKCLSCHKLTSCTASGAVRRSTGPPDNCIACHMPKRNLATISHSALTNHRIVLTADEPFPAEAHQMTSQGLPDLVHLSLRPGKKDDTPPLVVLRAYRQAMLVDPSYRPRYWELGQQLASAHPDDLAVLQALTDVSLQRKDQQGVDAAIRHLEQAVAQPGADWTDFMLLARLYLSTGRVDDSMKTLTQGMGLFPYNPTLYRFLGQAYFSTGQDSKACAVLSQADHLFPQYDDFRSALNRCGKQANP